MNTILKNAKIITATDTFIGDVGIQNEKIAAIDSNLENKLTDSELNNTNIYDISGKYLLPGAIDAHTHLALDVGFTFSSDDYFTGTRGAACGGTTTVIDYPTQYKGEKIVDAVEKRIKMAQDQACVDYAFHCALTNLEGGKLLDQFEEAIAAGITSFKCYMVYKERGMRMEDDDIFRILEKTKKTGTLLNVHAEDEETILQNIKKFKNKGKTSAWYHYASRPEPVSGAAVKRLVKLVKQTEAPLYIVHTDSDLAIEQIIEAKKQGYKIFSETCPQYLEFTNEVYKRQDGVNFICSPPIKGKPSQDALWSAIKDGYISTIATDHCPFTLEEKARGLDDFTEVPNGCGSIENSYPYMLSKANEGVITFNKAVELCSTNPSKIFGCKNKGQVKVGYDADLVVYDPDKDAVIKNKNMHTKSDYTIWEGVKMHGYPVMTFLRGMLVYDNDKFVGKPGWGKYIKRGLPEIN